MALSNLKHQDCRLLDAGQTISNQFAADRLLSPKGELGMGAQTVRVLVSAVHRKPR